MKYDQVELAWAAGFFDGEGSTILKPYVNSRYRDSTPGLELRVAQDDPRPLRRFFRALGVGRFYGPYVSKKRPGRTWFSWAAQSRDDIQIAALLLWPYLSGPKREQMHAAFTEFHALRNLRRVRPKRWHIKPEEAHG
jgi:hypothetical protein